MAETPTDVLVAGNGLGWAAGSGSRVGLLAPPVLASVAVGAVAGGVIGEFAGHRVERDIPGHSDSQGERCEPEPSRR